MATQLKVPEEAFWFGLEAMAADGSWIPLESSELGGPWWQLSTVDPVNLAKQAAGDHDVTFRVTWRKKDRRFHLGQSLPFRSGEASAPVVSQPPPAQPPPPPPSDPRTAPPAAPPQGPPRAPEAPPSAATPWGVRPPQQPTRKANGGNGGHYVQPKIPMAFTPPPGADPHLTTFVFLNQLCQQQNDRFLTMVLTMYQAQAASAEARARESIESMRNFLGAMDQGNKQLQAAMLSAQKSDQTPMAIVELQRVGNAQTEAIAQMGTKLAELEVDDGQPLQLSDNPNNVERVMSGVQGIVSAVANSPSGPAIASAIKQQGSAAVAHELAHDDPPQQQQWDEPEPPPPPDDEPDWEEGPPPQ